MLVPLLALSLISGCADRDDYQDMRTSRQLRDENIINSSAMAGGLAGGLIAFAAVEIFDHGGGGGDRDSSSGTEYLHSSGAKPAPLRDNRRQSGYPAPKPGSMEAARVGNPHASGRYVEVTRHSQNGAGKIIHDTRTGTDYLVKGP